MHEKLPYSRGILLSVWTPLLLFSLFLSFPRPSMAEGEAPTRSTPLRWCQVSLRNLAITFTVVTLGGGYVGLENSKRSTIAQAESDLNATPPLLIAKDPKQRAKQLQDLAFAASHDRQRPHDLTPLLKRFARSHPEKSEKWGLNLNDMMYREHFSELYPSDTEWQIPLVGWNIPIGDTLNPNLQNRRKSLTRGYWDAYQWIHNEAEKAELPKELLNLNLLKSAAESSRAHEKIRERFSQEITDEHIPGLLFLELERRGLDAGKIITEHLAGLTEKDPGLSSHRRPPTYGDFPESKQAAPEGYFTPVAIRKRAGLQQFLVYSRYGDGDFWKGDEWVWGDHLALFASYTNWENATRATPYTIEGYPTPGNDLSLESLGRFIDEVLLAPKPE